MYLMNDLYLLQNFLCGCHGSLAVCQGNSRAALLVYLVCCILGTIMQALRCSVNDSKFIDGKDEHLHEVRQDIYTDESRPFHAPLSATGCHAISYIPLILWERNVVSLREGTT